MSTFITEFKKTYYDDKITKGNVNDIRKELISIFGIYSHNLNKEEVIMLVDYFISESGIPEKEKLKMETFCQILNPLECNTDFDDLYNKYKNEVITNENLKNLRINIIKRIEELLHIRIIDENNNWLDDNLFIKYVSYIKEFIYNFIEKYHIQNFNLESSTFSVITEEFQTFNNIKLLSLFNIISNFLITYNNYFSFLPLLNIINNIKNIFCSNNKVNMNDNISVKIDEIASMLKSQSFDISQKFKQLFSENYKISKNIENMNNEINNLKSDNQYLKEDNQSLNQRLQKLETKIDAIKQHLLCPITHSILKDPVVIPSGVSYERESIEEWINNHQSDPYNLSKNTTKEQIYKNVALKNEIEEIKKC